MLCVYTVTVWGFSSVCPAASDKRPTSQKPRGTNNERKSAQSYLSSRFASESRLTRLPIFRVRSIVVARVEKHSHETARLVIGRVANDLIGFYTAMLARY